MNVESAVITGKSPAVHVVDLHHRVLLPWCALRRTLDFAPRVLSFDFHTDTLSGISRGLPPPQAGDYTDIQKVECAIRELHHDEHFDWALRSGTVSEVRICSIAPQNGDCAHPGMKVHSLPFPGGDVNIIFQDPDSCREILDQALSDDFLQKILEDFSADPTPFLLDIDCDFFLTEKMLASAGNPFFSCLARSALLITLSLEEDWVRLLQLPGEKLTGECIVRKLQNILR